MKSLLLLALAILGGCALESEPVTRDAGDEDAGVGLVGEELSAAMTWPSLKTRGYDTMNALKCFVDGQGGNNSTCTYGVGYNGVPCGGGWACSKCKSNGWGGFTYTSKIDPYSGKGELWIENNRIVSSVALGPLLANDLRTFSYDSGKYCRVFKSWGGYYAEFGP